MYDQSFANSKEFINGKYKKGLINYDDYRYLSALEGYICLKGANIKGIIAYLKGETKKLVL